MLSNIFLILLWFERYHRNCQAVLAAIGMNDLTYCKVQNIGVLKFSELIKFSILANRNISV